MQHIKSIILYAIFLFLCLLPSDAVAQTEYLGFDWAKQLTGNHIENITSSATDVDGNLFIAGSFRDTVDADPGVDYHPLISKSLYDCFVIKLTANGTFTWALCYGGKGNSHINAIDIDPFGNLLIAGNYTDTVDFDPSGNTFNKGADATLKEMYVLKLNNDGVFKWAKTFGSPFYESEECYDICTDSIGNVYTVGYFARSVDFNPDSAQKILSPLGDADAFLQKLDSNGGFVLATNIGTDKRAYAVTIDKHGQLFYAGTSTGGLNGYQISVSRLRENGLVKWSRQTGSTAHDIAYDVATDDANNVYVTGHFIGTVSFGSGGTLSSSSSNAPFLWKLDMDGNTIWAREVQGPWSSSKNAEGNRLRIRGNTVYIVGNAYTINVPNGFYGQYDTSGNNLFTTIFQSTKNSNQCADVSLGMNGIVYVTNNFSKSIDFNPGNDTFFLRAPIIQSYTDGAIIRFTDCTPSSDTIYVTTCVTYFDPKGKEYQTSGTYKVMLKNTRGCDSLLTMVLTIYPRILYGPVYKTACDSFIMPSGKRIVNSGLHYDTLKRAITGCDSIFAFDLYINHPSSSNVSVNSCGPYTFGTQTYTSSGKYTLRTNNSSGCDSIITLNLTIISFDTAIKVQGKTVMASDSTSTYQWLMCNQQYAPVNGAKSRTFTPSVSGNYAVKLSRSGCSDTSRCVSMTVAGAKEISIFNSIRIYPNPMNNEIDIDFADLSMNDTKLELTDMTGKVLQSITPVSSLQTLHFNGPAGIYFLTIRSAAGSATYKIVKS